MAGRADNVVHVVNWETIRICHGTMTNPARRPQPGFPGQVMMQHDKLYKTVISMSFFTATMFGVLAIYGQGTAELGQGHLDLFSNLICKESSLGYSSALVMEIAFED